MNSETMGKQGMTVVCLLCEDILEHVILEVTFECQCENIMKVENKDRSTFTHEQSPTHSIHTASHTRQASTVVHGPYLQRILKNTHC